jgi:hypothetical protein
MRRRLPLPLVMPVLLLLQVACGRTAPLHFVPPDAGADAGVDGGLVPCIPGTVTLTRARATVMFVIDRSGSMNDFLGFAGTKWDALTLGLSRSLPAVDQTMAIGAYLFPGGLTSSCVPPAGPALLPGIGHVAPLVNLLDRTSPGGGTPTAEALDRAALSLRDLRTARSARALVLATDGLPGCNGALDPRTCTCTNPDPFNGTCVANNCLDDVRTVSRLQEVADGGIPTWVIGIQSAADAVFEEVLNRMAAAGGRPRAGLPAYYPASSPQELEAALVSVRDQVGGCTFLTASVPDAQGDIRVLVNGDLVPEAPAGAAGWSWADRDNGELVFSGHACVVAGQDAVVTATVGCTPGAGP